MKPLPIKKMKTKIGQEVENKLNKELRDYFYTYDETKLNAKNKKKTIVNASAIKRSKVDKIRSEKEVKETLKEVWDV